MILNLKGNRFQLNVRNKFFTVSVVRGWNRLPKELMAAPSPAVFESRRDGALSNLIWSKVSMPMAERFELHDF